MVENCTLSRKSREQNISRRGRQPLGPQLVVVEETAHHPRAVIGQGIFAAAQAPVVHQGPLGQGIGLHKLVGGDILPDLPPLLPFQAKPAQQPVIDPVVVQQVLVPPGDQLHIRQQNYSSLFSVPIAEVSA